MLSYDLFLMIQIIAKLLPPLSLEALIPLEMLCIWTLTHHRIF